MLVTSQTRGRINLQLFADPAQNPTAGGNQPPAGDPNQQPGQPAPKTYTEEDVLKIADAAAAKARRETEGKLKPQLDAAQEALDAAKPFIENPTAYMTQFLAQNPQLIQTVADGVDRMLKGGVPTAAQVAAVGRAADSASDPKVAKKLETLEAEMKALRESTQEQQTLASELKTFGKEARAEGLDWDEDAFKAFVDKYAEDNEIGDDDSVDTRLLFRLWKAEQKLAAGPTRRAPRLPGGAPPPSSPGGKDPKKASWDDLEAVTAAALRAGRAD